MKRDSRTGWLIYWTPRILSIFFTIFISLFALDVFGEGYVFWKAILAFLIHLIPTFILIAVIWISWREELVGAALFFILGITYFIMSWGKATAAAYLLMIGPVFLTGILFALNKFLE